MKTNKKNNILVIAILFIFGLFLLQPLITRDEVMAQNSLAEVNVGAYPGTSGYFFKRLKEKALTTLTFSKNKKNKYLKILFNVRLAELSYIIENYKTENIEETSARYSYYAGVLAENTMSMNKQTKDEIIELYRLHLEHLPKLRDKTPANKTYWLVVQQNIDTLNILINNLQK